MCFPESASTTAVAPGSRAIPKDHERYHQALAAFPLPNSYPNYPCSPNRDWMRLYKGIQVGDMEDGRSDDTHWNGVDAVQTLLDYFDAPRQPAAERAADRLTALASYDETAWTPDIIFKAFDDLDVVLFGGLLLGNIELSWMTEEQMRKINPNVRLTATTIPFSVPVREIDGTISRKHAIAIRMNAQRIFLDASEHGDFHGVETLLPRWANMWRNLVHEMVHCYLAVAVGMEFPDHCRRDADPGHGFYYQTLNSAVSLQMREIFGFGLPPYSGGSTLPDTPELKRLERAWLKEFVRNRREKLEKWAKTTEEWAELFPASAPNIPVW